MCLHHCSSSLFQLIQLIYPDLYRVDDLSDEGALEDSEDDGAEPFDLTGMQAGDDMGEMEDDVDEIIDPLAGLRGAEEEPFDLGGSEAPEFRVRGHDMDQFLRRGISLKWLTEAHEDRPASTLSGEVRRIPLNFDNAPLGNPLYLSAWRAIVH